MVNPTRAPLSPTSKTLREEQIKLLFRKLRKLSKTDVLSLKALCLSVTAILSFVYYYYLSNDCNSILTLISSKVLLLSFKFGIRQTCTTVLLFPVTSSSSFAMAAHVTSSQPRFSNICKNISRLQQSKNARL